MKKILLFSLIGLILCACGSENYNVTLRLTDASQDGKTAYLIDYDSGDTINSAVVTGDSVVFTGEVPEAIVARACTPNGKKFRFILEGGDIIIDFKNRLATGTDGNDELNKFENEIDAISAKFEEKLASAISATDTINIEKAMEQELHNFYKRTYEDNKENNIGYLAFLEYTYEFTSQQFDEILKDAPDRIKKSKRVQKWVQGAKNKENTSVGHKYTDFTIKTDGGEDVFSTFVGTGDYVLVDFWASWCGPCRKEIPNLKQLLNKYEKKGLRIVGVAVWDKPQDTVEAIHQLGITWPVMFNAQSIPTDIYGILGIPHIMLIGPDGTILARGLVGEELATKVASFMDNLPDVHNGEGEITDGEPIEEEFDEPEVATPNQNNDNNALAE